MSRLARPVAWRGRDLRYGLLIALAVLLPLLLPAAHPETRLFSDGWGASSFIDPDFCVADTTGQGQPAPLTLFAKTPAATGWYDRLALLTQYLLWGLLLPVLAPALVARRYRAPATTPSALFICFALLGLAPAWFHWPLSPAFVGLRQMLGSALVEHWNVTESLFVWIDGAALLLWLGGGALLLGGSTCAALWAAARLARSDWRGLAPALLPLAAATLFLGLSMDSALYLRGEGVNLDWLPDLRATLLTLAVAASGWLGWRTMQKVDVGGTAHRAAAAVLWLLPSAVFALNGWLLFFHWTDRYHV